VQAIINLGISIILVKNIGITGVFIGTLISQISVPFWTTPYLVYKKVFKMKLASYYSQYLLYLLILVTTYFLTSVISSFISIESYISLIALGIICVIVPNVVFVLIFRNTDEFQYVMNIFKSVFRRQIVRLRED